MLHTTFVGSCDTEVPSLTHQVKSTVVTPKSCTETQDPFLPFPLPRNVSTTVVWGVELSVWDVIEKFLLRKALNLFLYIPYTISVFITKRTFCKNNNWKLCINRLCHSTTKGGYYIIKAWNYILFLC